MKSNKIFILYTISIFVLSIFIAKDHLLDAAVKLTFNDLQLGNVQIGMQHEVVDKSIKSKVVNQEIQDGTLISIDYEDGTTIVFQAGRVQFISVSNSKYPTPRGLAVGDSKDKAYKLYGEPNDGTINDSCWVYSITSDSDNFTILFKGKKIIRLEVHILEI